MSKINLAEKFARFHEHWTPKIVAESNGQLVKLAKAEGEMVWHKHDDEDELFLVFKGRLTLKMRDGEVSLGPGEMYVMPKGVEHLPIAEPDTQILLVEPASTLHTGARQSDVTVPIDKQEWI